MIAEHTCRNGFCKICWS